MSVEAIDSSSGDLNSIYEALGLDNEGQPLEGKRKRSDKEINTHDAAMAALEQVTNFYNRPVNPTLAESEMNLNTRTQRLEALDAVKQLKNVIEPNSTKKLSKSDADLLANMDSKPKIRASKDDFDLKPKRLKDTASPVEAEPKTYKEMLDYAASETKPQTKPLKDKLDYLDVARHKNTEPLDYFAFKTLYPQVELSESRIRDYLETIEGNSTKIKFLEVFKQEVRAAGGNIDWENNPEKKAMVEQAKEYGLKLPDTKDGKLKFDEKQKGVLLLNIDSTIDPLLSANDKQKVMLGWFQNKQSEWLALLSNIIKKHHENVQDMLRKWS